MEYYWIVQSDGGWKAILRYFRLQQFLFGIIFSEYQQMSFQNSVSEDGSININVIPSFGHIVNIGEGDRNKVVYEVQQWRRQKGALHNRPQDFDPSRYASFSVKESVEEPVASEHIHAYVEQSRLSRRLGF